MKTYKKEQCKQELEHHIAEKIKGFFNELKKQSEEKNKNVNMNYFDHNLHQADQAIKNLSLMRGVSRNIITKIDNLKKLKRVKKDEYIRILDRIYVIFEVRSLLLSFLTEKLPGNR